jgi:hypothetical protein
MGSITKSVVTLNSTTVKHAAQATKCWDSDKEGPVVGWLALIALFLCEIFFLAPTHPTTQPTQLAIIMMMNGNTSI